MSLSPLSLLTGIRTRIQMVLELKVSIPAFRGQVITNTTCTVELELRTNHHFVQCLSCF
jgi:hypothetical protein